MPAEVIAARFETMYHAFAWFIPLYGAIAVATLDGGFAPTGPWCWISSKYSPLRMVFYYVPIWIVLIYNMFMAIYVIFYVRRLLQNATAVDSSKRVAISRRTYRQLFYVIFMVVGNTLGTTNRLYQLLNNDYSPFWMAALSTTMLPLQGFWNGAIYIALDFYEASRRRRGMVSENTEAVSVRRRLGFLFGRSGGSRTDQSTDV